MIKKLERKMQVVSCTLPDPVANNPIKMSACAEHSTEVTRVDGIRIDLDY